jgi:hypothetical protein
VSRSDLVCTNEKIKILLNVKILKIKEAFRNLSQFVFLKKLAPHNILLHVEGVYAL